MSDSRTIGFSEEDLALFSQASGDRNPLHLSIPYASRTAYGERVVFGALGCLASLGSLETPLLGVKEVSADFHRPLFLQVNYRCEVKQTAGTIVARLFDGSTPVLTTTVKMSSEMEPLSPSPEAANVSRKEARVFEWNEIHVGQELFGEYRAEPTFLQQLITRWELKIDPLVAESLLWSSYFVGMELPGRTALFFRVGLRFHETAGPSTPLQYCARVSTLNPALSQIRTAVELRSGQKVVVSGQLTSFFRAELPALDLSGDKMLLGSGLRDKVAVVLGASRGLGAALAVALASEGAQVVAASRSKSSWGRDLPEAISSRITPWQGDASDAQSVSHLADLVSKQFGRLDFLICSAFPSIPSLRLEPTAVSRIQGYLQRATNLVLLPLVTLLPDLSRSGGCLVLISSSAVIQPVRDWPHYGAAKSAAESLCRVAVMQYPETSLLIVRPEKLLTEMTNTPIGRQGAASPIALAKQLSARLQSPPAPGTCNFYDPRTAPAEWLSDSERTENVELSLP